MALVDCGNGVRLERGLVCRLEDETTLVSDHYYPAGSGPWPTLLMRQPYGRDIASTVVYAHPVWFARQGYHVVIQDVRGRGDSDGFFYPFRHEGRDGAETIAWLRRHPACNGFIGMYGFSYQGATQLLAAAEQPEGLMCIAPHMAAADLYHGWFYHQGALRLSSTLGWGIQMLREDARRLRLQEASDSLERAWTNQRAQALEAPYASIPALQSEGLPGYVLDWISHREPGDYWSQLDISTRYDHITIPALHLSGWYDFYLSGSVAGYRALRAGAGSAFARENQYLLAGPWIHIPWGERAGETRLGDAARLNTDELLLRWFNHWLKGTEDFTDEPRIRYFTLGANEWRAAPEWPESVSLSLYLHSEGKANSSKGDGTLAQAPPLDEEPRDVFVHDPEVPVTTPGGGQALSGAYDQAVLEMGNHVLVYRSDTARRDAEIFGEPKVVLYAATSQSHTDFTAKLVRERANGGADFICMGIARSSWLFGDEQYAADVIHRWEFSLEPTAFLLRAGERILLEIASSAFPLYDRNPGTAVSPQAADHWSWRRSTQQVLHTAECPSALYLPVAGTSPWE